ncbi:MAG: GldG family protein [Elusimicrobiota bacterium]
MEALRRVLQSIGRWLVRLAGSREKAGEPASKPAGRQVGLLSTAAVLLAGGSLVFLFLLSSQFYLRLDLSAGKLYSLSPGSKRLLRALEVPIEIRAYFSKELPPQYAASRSYVRDLLAEYRSASGGKVRARFIDLEREDEGKREAMKHGVAPIQFNVVSKEKYEVREGFMGLVMQHADKKEVIPVVAETEGLEYDLTSRIVRLTRERRKVIGMVSSHEALSPGKLNDRVRDFVERNYELRGIDLAELAPGATIAADVSGLLLLGPMEKLTDAHLYALDQFLLSGRPLVAGLDTRKVDLQSFFATDVDTGLPGWLEHNGVRVKKEYVLDLQSQKVSLAQQRGWFTVTNIIDYPYFVISTDLSDTHPVTRHLDSLTLPFSSPLEVSTRTAAGEALVLARSSRASWLSSDGGRRGFQSVNPMQKLFPKPGDAKGPYALAVSLEDSFTSYFSTAAGSARPIPAEADAGAFLAASRGKSRLLVVGTSRFIDPQMSRRDTGPVFLLNVIDWLALDSELISIRSKGVVFRPLREIPAGLKKTVRWGNILAPAALVIGFGMFRFYGRRRRRGWRVAAYSPSPSEPYAAQDA